MKVSVFSFLAIGAVMAITGFSSMAQAQVFLRNDNSGSTGATNSGKSGSASSNIFITPDSNGGGADSNYYKDKYKDRLNAMRQRDTNLDSGTTYSIEEYNRRLLAQRQSAANGRVDPNAVGKGGGYGSKASSEDMLTTNPYTGRYASKRDIREMTAIRERYYASNKGIQPKMRTLSEERFFNKNGYYEDDAKALSGTKEFGSRIMLNEKRSTSNKYKESADRFVDYSQYDEED